MLWGKYDRVSFLGLGLKRAAVPDGPLIRTALTAQDVFLRGLDLPAADAQQTRLTSPYAQHSTVFACIRTIYTTFVQAPFVLLRGKQEVTTGPVFQLLQRPAPFLSNKELWQYTVLFLELTGNALWWLDNDGQRARIPRNILVFHPRFFRLKKDPRTDIPVGYTFTPGRGRAPIFLSNDEIVHFRYPNPEDPFWGLGPLQVARLAAEQDHKADLYNSAFFENSAEPSALLLYKGQTQLTEDQKQDLMTSWGEQHRGATRAFKVGVLPGGDWDYKQIGLSQKDMQFIELKMRHERDIAKVFGVPPLFVGDYEKSGLSDAGLRVQYRLFWDTNLIPKGDLIEDKVNAEFLSRYDTALTGKFDIDEIPALKDDYTEKLANAKTLHDMHVPFNQINEKLQLGFDPIPWGDDVHVPHTLVPISALGETPEHPPEEKETPRQVLPGAVPALLRSRRNERAVELFWRSFISSFAPLENRYASRLRRFFFDLRGRSLNALSEVYGQRAFSTGDVSAVLAWLMGAKREVQILSAPFFQAAFQSGGLMLLGEIGQEDSVFVQSQDALRFLELKQNTIVGIVETVWSQVREQLVEGFSANESLTQTANRVRSVFNAAANRARTIARTEIGGALSGGRFEALQQQRVRHHSWLSARDPHVRDAHAPNSGVDGEVRKVGERFSNGLRYPHDPNGPASQVINCFLPGTQVSGRFFAGLKAWYSGEAVEIITRNGYRLAVTVNHPILTDRGFVSAGTLQKGDHVICQHPDVYRGASRRDGHYEQRETSVENVFDALSTHGSATLPVQPLSFNLHGDAQGVRGQIKRVVLLSAFPVNVSGARNMELMRQHDAPLQQRAAQCSFVLSDHSQVSAPLAAFSRPTHALPGQSLPAHGTVGGACLLSPSFGGGMAPLQRLGLASIPRGDAVAEQDTGNDPATAGEFSGQGVDTLSGAKLSNNARFSFLWDHSLRFGHAANLHIARTQESVDGLIADAQLARQLLNTDPFLIALDNIVGVRHFNFSGHVYDLQSPVGYLIAGGLASSNCRCTTVPVVT